jgi:pimeloyl-ACP methyl ester carboxylesterase
LHRRVVARFDVAATTAMCSAWPAVDAPLITRIKGRVPNPVLLIGNQFDSRTSLSWARSMARTLGMESSLIRYEGGGHTAYGLRPGARIACIDSAVEGYLFDLRVPPEGFACAAQPVAL